MKKNNKKLKFISLILLIIFCLYFQTVVYSAISSKLMITGDAVARIRSNVRINKFRIHEVSDGVISSYEEFSKTYTMSNVTLPNSDSYIIYELVIGNYEDVEMQLSSITGLPSNLTYELIDYSLHDMICDNTNKCFGGVEKTLYLKIKYANYNASGTNYNINLEYEFKEFSNTLMVGTSFRDTIPSTATHLVFTDEKPVSGVVLTDVSENQDMGVVGYLDGTTYKVSTRRTGVMPEANAKSSHMFSESALQSIDLTNLNTSNVVSMMSMFYNCSLLTEINFTNFNTSKVTTMESMFQACGKLSKIELSNFDTSSVTSMRRMFLECYSLTELDLSKFNTSSVTTMYSMFADCPNITKISLSNFDTSKTTNMYSMFRNCKNLIELDLSNFDTSSVTTMERMFYNCNALTNLNLKNFITSNVTDMYGMFYGCENLLSLDLSSFNTSKVTRMNYMFYNCMGLTSLDLSNFITSKVINMYGMFQYCKSLTSLNVSSFDTSDVTNMNAMFAQNWSLQNIDLSSFNIKNVTSMNNMFYTDSKLENIYVGIGWDSSNISNSQDMFYDCVKLPNFNSSVVDATKAYVGDGGYLSYPPKTFNIDGVAYKYEEGMTWRDWVDSSYDTRGFVNNNDLIYTDDLMYALVYEEDNGSYTSYSWPYIDDLIDPNLVYVTFYEAGEDGEW